MSLSGLHSAQFMILTYCSLTLAKHLTASYRKRYTVWMHPMVKWDLGFVNWAILGYHLSSAQPPPDLSFVMQPVASPPVTGGVLQN